MPAADAFLAAVNHARWHDQPGGHYESYFLRGNHPTRPLAFWIRYTVFSPAGRPADALGELWAVWFDGEHRRHVAVKREVPIARCRFARDAFDVRVDDACLAAGHLAGAAASGAHRIAWDLTFHGEARPLLLLPPALYGARLPRAKSLVALPLARFDGTLDVDGARIDLADWVGSQNHNWGSRHTDLYAWGQVAGFDGAPDAFLEVATARLRFGPFWTPPMTLVALRHRGEEHALTTLARSLRARGTFDYRTWRFQSAQGDLRIEGRIEAEPDAFVGLRYLNPPGGTKSCLNTKIARAEITVSRGGKAETLRTAHRAAFEILTDATDHGVPLVG